MTKILKIYSFECLYDLEVACKRLRNEGAVDGTPIYIENKHTTDSCVSLLLEENKRFCINIFSKYNDE